MWQGYIFTGVCSQGGEGILLECILVITILHASPLLDPLLLRVCLPIHPCICVSVCPSIHVSACLSVCPSVHVASVSPCICLSVCTSIVCMSVSPFMSIHVFINLCVLSLLPNINTRSHRGHRSHETRRDKMLVRELEANRVHDQ